MPAVPAAYEVAVRRFLLASPSSWLACAQLDPLPYPSPAAFVALPAEQADAGPEGRLLSLLLSSGRADLAIFV